jgi:hypothetical protein
MKLQSQNNSQYGFPSPISQAFPNPIVQNRAPNPQDTGFPIGQTWIWTSQNAYTLLGVSGGLANWVRTTNNFITNQITTTDATETPIFFYTAPNVPTATTLTFSIVAIDLAGAGSVFFYGTILVSTDGTTLTEQQLTNLVNAQVGSLDTATFNLYTNGNTLSMTVIGASAVNVDWNLVLSENTIS